MENSVTFTMSFLFWLSYILLGIKYKEYVWVPDFKVGELYQLFTFSCSKLFSL